MNIKIVIVTNVHNLGLADPLRPVQYESPNKEALFAV